MTAPTRSDSSQAVQAYIAAQAASLLQRLWPSLDHADLSRALPEFKLAVAAIVRRYGQAAATAALTFYRRQRVEAGVSGVVRLSPAKPAGLQQVGQSTDWAVAPLRQQEPDRAAAVQRLDSTVERLVLNTGRETVIHATRQDRAAKAWARVPEPGCCSFCALLATRGAVYKHDTAGFEAHDHCRCHVEPVFTAYEPSAQVREWQRMYSQIKHGSPAAMRREFRRVYEGRA